METKFLLTPDLFSGNILSVRGREETEPHPNRTAREGKKGA